MSQLPQLEREAKLTRDLIEELKGLTPRFNATKERAEDELRLHLAKIDSERAHLATLIDAAALIVQHLGASVPEPELPEPVVAVADSPQDEATDEFVTLGAAAEDVVAQAIAVHDAFAALVEELFTEQPAGHAEEPEPTFEYVAAAVEQIAGSPPEPDASDEPEMTDEQVERAEQTLAAVDHIGAAEERELETVGGDRPARRFNPFANNPFA
jgi:hypothetical protein